MRLTTLMRHNLLNATQFDQKCVEMTRAKKSASHSRKRGQKPATGNVQSQAHTNFDVEDVEDELSQLEPLSNDSSSLNTRHSTFQGMSQVGNLESAGPGMPFADRVNASPFPRFHTESHRTNQESSSGQAELGGTHYPVASRFVPYQPIRAVYGLAAQENSQSGRPLGPESTSRSGRHSLMNLNEEVLEDQVQSQANVYPEAERWAQRAGRHGLWTSRVLPGNAASLPFGGNPPRVVPSVLPSIETPQARFSTSAWTNQSGTHKNREPSKNNRRATTPRKTASPPAPDVSTEYVEQASGDPIPLSQSRRLLVILDLNGTLLHRPSKGDPTKFHLRPGVTPFLEYLFENHIVMVYTSTRPENAQAMITNLLHPKQRSKLVAIWARDKLDLNKDQYNAKVQVYKKLGKVWSDANIMKTARQGEKWDQTNTVLIDDSHLKALAQPHNLVQVPEFIGMPPSTNDDSRSRGAFIKTQSEILQQLRMKLETLKWQGDVSRLIRQWQTGKAEVPRLPGQEVVVEESVDQKSVVQAETDENLNKGLESIIKEGSLPHSVAASPRQSSNPPKKKKNKKNKKQLAHSEEATTTTAPRATKANGNSSQIPGLGLLDEPRLPEERSPSHSPPSGPVRDQDHMTRPSRTVRATATAATATAAAVPKRSESPISESVFIELLDGSSNGGDSSSDK